MLRLAGFFTALVCSTVVAQSPDFARDIQPVLAKRCFACHGPAQQMNGLRLDDPNAAAAVIVPGDSAKSKLIERVVSEKKGFQMPPGGPPLSPKEIAALKAWIDAGAKFPAGGPVKSNHWSFQPVRRPARPAVKNASWVRNDIDAFVLAKLEQAGVAPSPEAEKRVLARRLGLDLTGLPPAKELVAEYLADTGAGAYERLADKLLASPHYGEKWARHWLDLARYADSDGYEKDLVRPWSWRYRNWVIDAFNRDLPYDRFTVEQLAGDLLPNANTEQRVAVGFHRNALTNREAGVDRAEARFEQTVNRANTTGTVWLGLTVGCAQCHNHKYDAISQKEYYQLFAFFNNLEEREIDAPLPGETGPYLQARPAYDRERSEILKQYDIAALQADWENKMRSAISDPGKNLEWDFSVTSFKAMVDNGVKVIQTPAAGRSRRDAERLTNYFVRTPGPELSKDIVRRSCLEEARNKLAALDATLPEFTQAQSIVESDRPVETYLAVGGDYRNKGAVVEPGTLAVLPRTGEVRDRLELARWLVSRENPLTSRVAANRVWQELFGRGLVRTADDFGTQGEKPTHPELLDWLASEFAERGWSMKQLIRTVVTSATYRQSSTVRKELLARDPENALLARQARLRLPAELIRDSALASGGLLNTAIGGRSIRPPQPAGIAELGYANNVKWVESKGPERYRRGLYIHFQRTTPYPQLMTFDAPDSNVACTRRSRSNTPLQALNLLNDPVFFESAQAFGTRVVREAPAPAFQARLDYAFETALGRLPSDRERERLARYYDQALSAKPSLASFVPDGVRAQEISAWTSLARVILNLDEFITRE